MEALTQETERRPLADARALDEAIDRAARFLEDKQADTGAWLGDYGGPLFLLPMYLGTCYATNVAIPAETRAEMVRYLLGKQNEDGGWGLHIESHSYLFTSTIIYAALRLADVPADHPQLRRAREHIHVHGGPLAAASWGKFFLTLLNLHDYRGLNPVPPELWLLPKELPVHPSRLWCHTRMVYLPMSFLYGSRVQCAPDARIRAIRGELYDEPYETIDWESARDRVADSDAYTPVSRVMQRINAALRVYEKRPLAKLRERALAYALCQIEAEDLNTQYVCLGPVNKLYHLWVWHHVRPGGPELEKHVARLPEYLWQAEDGTKMQGYHSSQLWDTAFAAQALLASGVETRSRAVLERANDFIADNQITADLPLREQSFRDPTKGGWGFSAKDNGWIVSDCTAEGLRASLALAPLVKKPLPAQRMAEAVEYLLWSQMPCGGWASYEPARGPKWLELLNPSNAFGDIMIDYPYVECSAASMLALTRFREAFPGVLARRIDDAITRGRAFLLDAQREDGSFEGSWGICFTYGTWFGVEGLRAAGLPATHERIARACAFLARHQQPDGGWGETPESCTRRQYVHAEGGQAVMTAWALLALVAGGQATSPAAEAGVRFLIGRQREDGSYPAEHIAGVFNKTCAIHYDNYLKIFPLWALSEVRRHRRADARE